MATATYALTDYPFFLQAVTGDPPIAYKGEDFRRFVGALFPRTGIQAPGLRVFQASPVGWKFNVGPGIAILGDSSSAAQQRYIVHNQNTILVNLSDFSFNTAPTATRTHRVWLAVYDKQIAGTTNASRILVTEDTGAGAATPTTVSMGVAAALQIATVTIANGQSNIQNANISTLGTQHADSGYAWVDITLTSGLTSAATDTNNRPPRVRASGSTGLLRGAFKYSNGSTFPALTDVNIGRLTDEYRPSYTQVLTAAGAIATTVANRAQQSYRLTIDSDGYLTGKIPANYDPPILFLDGLQYELD